jgi:hydroxyacylglutathione hydrolase
LIKLLIRFAVAASVLTLAATAFAPFVYVELWPWLNRSSVINAEPVGLSKGRMFDDYFAVQDLGEGTFAIGEPRYYQANYSYLIVGEKRALLFDAGSGTRNIHPVVASLTNLPVTVMPSHLHYDHLAGITAFDHVALIDLPSTRAEIVNGRFSPSRYEFLGVFDGLKPPSFVVSQWIKPGASLDLGGRSLTVLSTPGHTASSVSLFDSRTRRLFTGDFIYPTMLYAFLPGASRTAYRDTAHRLLTSLPADTTLWAAHCCRRDEGYAAPWLTMDDLQDLDTALAKQVVGRLKSEGFFPRRYPVNRQMILGTGFPWNNR